MHGLGLIADDEVRCVAVPAQQRRRLVLRVARRHGGVGDLVAVEVQDRQHHAVAGRVEELVRVPARGRRPGLRRDVARDAAGEGELAEQRAQAVQVLADGRVDLAVGALQVGVRDEPGSAVAGTGDEEGVQVALPDRPVHVGVDQVEARGGAPVAEQARLDVLGSQRLAQQRVVQLVEVVRLLPGRRHGTDASRDHRVPKLDRVRRGVAGGNGWGG
ncbi:hypothetical protein GCM10027184_33570 [Saccharothrix stipae]